jgi:predicted outer membrane lipoprotein
MILCVFAESNKGLRELQLRWYFEGQLGLFCQCATLVAALAFEKMEHAEPTHRSDLEGIELPQWIPSSESD